MIFTYFISIISILARWPSGLRRTVQAYLDLLNLLSRFPCLARGVGSNPTLVIRFLPVLVFAGFWFEYSLFAFHVKAAFLVPQTT